MFVLKFSTDDTWFVKRKFAILRIRDGRGSREIFWNFVRKYNIFLWGANRNQAKQVHSVQFLPSKYSKWPSYNSFPISHNKNHAILFNSQQFFRSPPNLKKFVGNKSNETHPHPVTTISESFPVKTQFSNWKTRKRFFVYKMAKNHGSETGQIAFQRQKTLGL